MYRTRDINLNRADAPFFVKRTSSILLSTLEYHIGHVKI